MTAFPSVQAPVTILGGYITPVWHRFLQTLWDRTGGASGGVQTPTGSIVAYAGAVAPDGWFLCDGAEISRTVYSALFAVLNTTYGAGDGSTTFGLPDFQARVVLGADTIHPLGSSGGRENLTLTINELPSHNHGHSTESHTHTVTDPGHIHTVTDPGHVHTALVAASTNTTGTDAGDATAGNTGSAITGVSVDSATTGITIGDATAATTSKNTGKGNSFSILPPYQTVNYIIKT